MWVEAGEIEILKRVKCEEDFCLSAIVKVGFLMNWINDAQVGSMNFKASVPIVENEKPWRSKRRIREEAKRLLISYFDGECEDDFNIFSDALGDNDLNSAFLNDEKSAESASDFFEEIDRMVAAG